MQKEDKRILRIKNPWVVSLTAATIFLYLFIQMTMFNVLKPELMISFNADAEIIGFISSLYFYGNTIFLLPAGVLFDKYSARKIIIYALLISLIGVALCTFATSIFMMGVGRLIIGISGGSVCFLGSMRIAARWFPKNKLALVTGIIVAMAMIGGMIAQLPFGLLTAAIGWRTAMQLNLTVGVILLILIIMIVYDYPPGKRQEYLQQMKHDKNSKLITGLKSVITKAQNWNCSMFNTLLNMPIIILGALWGIMYLRQVLNFDLAQASTTCTVLFFGVLVGGPIFGYFSDKMQLRKPPMYIGAIMCLAAMVILLMFADLSFITVSILFFLIGFGSSAQIIAYPAVVESNPAALSGSALGLASTINIAGGAVGQPLISWVIESQWDGSKDPISGIPLFTASNYNFAFWIMPAAIIIAVIFIRFIRETSCKGL
jgi:MFS family permease